jgi:hypothetical protein
MEIVKVDDINWVQPSVYEVWFMDRLIFASEDVSECENYVEKWWFLYYNLYLLW